ncbi:MAG: hypothetical protein OHK0045_04070 [Raineya sp.]
MKKFSFVLLASVLVLFSYTNIKKFVSTKTHIKFFSTTAVENIEAHNYKAISTIDTESGEVVFSVPMQSFEFEKSLMQKHFNQPNFLDTKKYPKAKLVGKITNLNEIDFKKDGTYPATISGEMSIKGVSKPITEKGTITVKGGNIEAKSKFDITLADYGITFTKGKPASNIAKKVEVTVEASYQSE